MPLSTVYTKIGLTMLCLSGFELYSRWVPLVRNIPDGGNEMDGNICEDHFHFHAIICSSKYESPNILRLMCEVMLLEKLNYSGTEFEKVVARFSSFIAIR